MQTLNSSVRMAIVASISLLSSFAQVQQPLPTKATPTLPDYVLYKHFLNHVAAFRKKADSLSLQGAQGNNFRYYFQKRLGMTLHESEQVEAVALQLSDALASNSAQVRAIVKNFHLQNFPGNTLLPGTLPPPPPPALRQLTLQRRQLVEDARIRLSAILTSDSMTAVDKYVHTTVAANTYVVKSGQ